MNEDFIGSPSPENPQAPEGSCQFAGSIEQLGVGSVSSPRWMQAHLMECLSCMNDFARLQSLSSHADPVGRRWLGSRRPTHSETGVLEFVREAGVLMLERKKLWLLPLVVIVLLFGGLLVLTQGSAVAPSIYTLW
jgi:hypothetical protein